MRIRHTGDISDQVLGEALSDLSGQISVALDDRVVAYKSTDAPSWIAFVADLSAWKILGLIGAAYLTGLAKAAGAETWRERAAILSASVSGINQIKSLARAMAKMGLKVATRTQVKLQVPYPDDYFGTTLTISTGVPEVIEMELALFCIHADGLEQLFEQHAGGKVRPVTGYFLELEEDGSLTVWWHCKDLNRVEIRLPFPYTHDGN